MYEDILEKRWKFDFFSVLGIFEREKFDLDSLKTKPIPFYLSSQNILATMLISAITMGTQIAN